MVLFLRKRPTTQQPSPGYVPIDLVQRMASTGMPENEIASYLTRQGFSPGQIDIAMREALKAQVSAPPSFARPPEAQPTFGRPPPMRPTPLPLPPAPTPPGPMVPEEEAPPATPTMDFPAAPAEAPQEAPEMPGYPLPVERPMPSERPAPYERPAPARPVPPSYPPLSAMPPRRALGFMPPAQAVRARPELGVPPERIVPAATRPVEYATAPTEEEVIMGRLPKRIAEAPTEITLEEIVEGIVAEHWSEFEDRLANFEKRDIQLQAQIQDLKKAMDELEGRLKAKETDMVGRLEGMAESMTGIQGRIGGIEKVFKDFLPQMTENVRTMAEVVEKLRAGK